MNRKSPNITSFTNESPLNLKLRRLTSAKREQPPTSRRARSASRRSLVRLAIPAQEIHCWILTRKSFKCSGNFAHSDYFSLLSESLTWSCGGLPLQILMSFLEGRGELIFFNRCLSSDPECPGRLCDLRKSRWLKAKWNCGPCLVFYFYPGLRLTTEESRRKPQLG